MEENLKNSATMTQEQKKITISETELKIILNMLTVCSKRGVFQLEEYKVISELYTSLTSQVSKEN
jgi:hypothetical protein